MMTVFIEGQNILNCLTCIVSIMIRTSSKLYYRHLNKFSHGVQNINLMINNIILPSVKSINF